MFWQPSQKLRCFIFCLFSTLAWISAEFVHQSLLVCWKNALVLSKTMLTQINHHTIITPSQDRWTSPDKGEEKYKSTRQPKPKVSNSSSEMKIRSTFTHPRVVLSMFHLTFCSESYFQFKYFLLIIWFSSVSLQLLSWTLKKNTELGHLLRLESCSSHLV